MNFVRSSVLFCLFFCTCAVLLAADVPLKVVSVRAVPQWPWEGKIDIYYMVECDDADAKVELAFTGYDGDQDKEIELRKEYLSGDGIDTALEFGKEMHAVWNATGDIPNYHSSDFKVKVTATRSTDDEKADYMVIDLSAGSDATSYSVRYTNEAPDLTNDTCRTTELWLRRIPAGTFQMGSPKGEIGRWEEENMFETEHTVTITQDFYIGIFECTQKQYNLITGEDPSYYKGDGRPVEAVNYNMIRGSGSKAGAGWPTYGHTVDSSSFMGKLQARTNLTFDLPTEAQWEYACRKKADGTCWTTALNSGKNLTAEGTCANMAEVGRYRYNLSDGKGGYTEHTKVGSYLPSELGLYDMHGNVYEWCLDWYGEWTADAVTDPTGSAMPEDETYRAHIVRSGAWYYEFCDGASGCRAAARNCQYPEWEYFDVGFRIACFPAAN